MKQALIILTLIIGIFGCSNNKKNVIIQGKIAGEIPQMIEYSVPENGICYLGFKKSVNPDSMGNFYITVNIEEPAFIKLKVPDNSPATMMIEPGHDYLVNIDLNSENRIFKFSNKNSKGQEFYNSLPNDGDIFRETNAFKGNVNLSDIEFKLDSIKNNEISFFSKLHSNGEISRDFLNLIKLDRDCHYYAIMTSVLFSKYVETSQKNNKALTDTIIQEWNKLYGTLQFPNLDFSRSPSFYTLVDKYLTYCTLTDKSPREINTVDINSLGAIYLNTIETSKGYFKESFLEYFEAVYLYDRCIQLGYEKELITIYEDFSKNFPNSAYTKYLEPLIGQIVEYQQKIEQPLNENIHFINPKGKNTLSEYIKQFEGKKVYIDVWATWCGPCKEEFEYIDNLHKLLKSKNIETLFISIDKEDKENQWRDLIKFYNLEGYHILANSDLSSNLYSLYGNNGSMTIPWYILIDEDGSILEKHAKRPSQIEQLEKQLNEK